MIRRLALAGLIALFPALALAQFATIGATPVPTDNSDKLATTSWMYNNTLLPQGPVPKIPELGGTVIASGFCQLQFDCQFGGKYLGFVTSDDTIIGAAGSSIGSSTPGQNFSVRFQWAANDITITYTAIGGDTTASIATSLCNLVNANTTIHNATTGEPIFCQPFAGSASFNIQWSYLIALTLSSTGTGTVNIAATNNSFDFTPVQFGKTSVGKTLQPVENLIDFDFTGPSSTSSGQLSTHYGIMTVNTTNTTTGSQAGQFVFSTPNGSAIATGRLGIGLGAYLYTGAGALPVGGDAGAGNINIPGTYFVNGVAARSRLGANADYYVRRDGNDSNTGTANTAGGAWLTIGKSLVTLAQTIDLNGFNVIVHVQGANVGDGTYTENLIVPGWTGYTGQGFGQFIVQAENGVATINGATAAATILAAIGGNATPVQFKNFVLANPNTNGIIVEGDDGGFIALNNITFGSTGAGGIIAICTQEAGRLLFMASTFTMKAGLSTGTGFYGRSGCGVIFQPGVTINFAGASTFSNAVVDLATNAYFDDTGSTWSGTIPTGKKYNLDKNSGGLIVDVSLIPGTVTATITPLSPGNGGTGQIDGVTPSTTCGASTPTLLFGGASVGITYGTRTCQYTKVGKIVTIDMTIVLTSKGSSVGGATLTGLPVTIANAANGVCGLYAGMSTLVGGIYLNAGTGTVLGLNTGGPVQTAGLADTNFTNTSTLQCTVTFISS